MRGNREGIAREMSCREREEEEREGDKQRQASRKDDYAGDVVGIFHFPATFLPLHLTRESRGIDSGGGGAAPSLGNVSWPELLAPS